MYLFLWKGDTELSPLYWFTPQMPAVAVAAPDWLHPGFLHRWPTSWAAWPAPPRGLQEGAQPALEPKCSVAGSGHPKKHLSCYVKSLPQHGFCRRCKSFKCSEQEQHVWDLLKSYMVGWIFIGEEERQTSIKMEFPSTLGYSPKAPKATEQGQSQKLGTQGLLCGMNTTELLFLRKCLPNCWYV